MQPAELALRTILAWCRNRFSTPPKWSAGPTRRFSWCTSNGWPTPAGHKGRRTGRQPATRGARRASRSLHLAALAAPCSPYSSPRPSPTPRAFLAPAGCSWVPKRLPGPASGLPVGCLPLQCCLLLELCLSVRTVCSAPAAAGASLFGPLSVLQLLGVFGGAGGAAHGIGREQKRSWWSRFE